MSIRFDTNIVAAIAHRNLEINTDALNTSIEKLSSGLRINSASDDAAGMALSEQLSMQVTGLGQAQSNAQDGISLLQTADGALSETTTLLQRMRQLAVEAANDTMTASDRAQISDEMVQLSAEVNRVSDDTQFNTRSLLAGGTISTTGITLFIGANASQTMVVIIGTANAAALGVMTTQLSVDSALDASTTIANVDKALGRLMNIRSGLGAMENRLQLTVSNLQTESLNTSAAESQIRDLDMASEMATMTKYQVLQQASTAMLAQANQAPQSLLTLLKA